MAEPSATDSEFIVHPEPVWRELADFIINAELEPEDAPHRFEQLWTRKVDENRFEVCCIPFFLFDVSLGDIVETAPKDSRRFVLSRVVQPSGRYVFRVWFGESFHPRDEIAGELQRLGALIEWSSRNLLAVDATDGGHAQRIADFLHEREQQGQLLYETGRTA